MILGNNRKHHPAVRILKRIFALFLLLVLLLVVYLSTIGFPKWLVTEITHRINVGIFVLNAGSMKLAPFKGVIVNNAQINN
ncbi:hypothetical protein ACFLS1_10205 [Verrucomicrobiota bacterium]